MKLGLAMHPEKWSDRHLAMARQLGCETVIAWVPFGAGDGVWHAEDFERIRAVGNKVAEVVADWLEFFYGFHRKLGYPGAPVHDAVAVAALIKPEIMTFKDLYVQVETAGDYCKGTTVGDWYGVTGKAPNASCILDIDRQGFVDLLVEAVKTYA